MDDILGVWVLYDNVGVGDGLLRPASREFVCVCVRARARVRVRVCVFVCVWEVPLHLLLAARCHAGLTSGLLLPGPSDIVVRRCKFVAVARRLGGLGLHLHQPSDILGSQHGGWVFNKVRNEATGRGGHVTMELQGRPARRL